MRIETTGIVDRVGECHTSYRMSTTEGIGVTWIGTGPMEVRGVFLHPRWGRTMVMASMDQALDMMTIVMKEGTMGAGVEDPISRDETGGEKMTITTTGDITAPTEADQYRLDQEMTMIIIEVEEGREGTHQVLQVVRAAVVDIAAEGGDHLRGVLLVGDVGVVVMMKGVVTARQDPVPEMKIGLDVAATPIIVATPRKETRKIKHPNKKQRRKMNQRTLRQ